MANIIIPDKKKLVKWALSILLVSFSVGSTSAFFLYALQQVTSLRETHLWLLAFLPLTGVLIVWWYQQHGGSAQKGNNLLLEAYYNPRVDIPWKMAPMVLLSTLATHLFGGSAGREGTAIQYGGTIASQCRRWFSWSREETRILLLCGIAAGFASLFGTPWAGSIFAIEVVKVGKIRWKAVLPILVTALLSNWVCGMYGNLHTHYSPVQVVPDLSFTVFGYLILASIAFGLAAQLFIFTSETFHNIFQKIAFPLLRPLIGGLVVLLIVLCLQSTKHIGLGIPTILASFDTPLPPTDFLIKIVLTAITLSAGFKGGEVTPLFFIGATLGNALALAIPLPLALLAATGFVAVFAGCTKTPIACSIMAVELFGWHAALFFTTVCVLSFLVSGRRGIYSMQKMRKPERFFSKVFRS
ncbi:chloride channel protein [Sphingobacterium deserti]|uniref:Chloride channel core n=1 Tax=Sphingobacterium deserti TaxID=1229276 RepID=A0A0B8T5N6_9SPHI|nr:chloride channel protein [Sphingobacterium deserti]KGE15978.1 chloride channel core [Sphingobacterium deserti]